MNRLARAQWPFLYVHQYIDDVIGSHLVALEAARADGDRRGLATVHNYLAAAYFRCAESDRAAAHLHEALRLREELGDVVGASIIRGNLAGVLTVKGQLAEAWEHAMGAAVAWRRAPDGWYIPPSLSQLGVLSTMFATVPRCPVDPA